MKATPGNLCSHVGEGFIWALLTFMLTAEQMKSDDKVLDARQDLQPLIATFSVVAFDPLTGDLGVAVQSKFFGVGTVVPWAKANVGAVATQSYANITYGPEGLSLLEQNIHPKVALMQLTNSDNDNAYRQVSMIDASGRTSSFTGSRCNDWAGHIAGPNFVGNPIVGGVRALGDDNQLRQGGCRRTNATIGNQIGFQAVALGNTERFIFYGAGIGVDVDNRHDGGSALALVARTFYERDVIGVADGDMAL